MNSLVGRCCLMVDGVSTKVVGCEEQGVAGAGRMAGISGLSCC